MSPESFASGGLIWPTKPCPVLIDHEERFPVGFVSGVAERDGWHEATWVLDMDKPLSDVARDLLRVGTPVSLGAKSLLRDESLADLGLATPVKRHTTAVLQEVSILSPGVVPAYRGAKVIRITKRGTALDRMRERQRERVEAKPKPPKPATSVTPARKPQPVAIVHRTRDTRHDVDMAELNRRMDWYETRYGRQADPEQFIKSMRRELDGGPTLDELTRDRRVA